MKNPKYLLAGIAVLMLTIPPAVAQSSPNSDRLPAAKPDPQVAAALRDVSARRIEQTIVKLVSFYTRQTLSSDMPASSGKGATRPRIGSRANSRNTPRIAVAAWR